MKELIKFLRQSLEGADNKPSSKRLTAVWYAIITGIIAFVVLFLTIWVVFKKMSLPDSSIRLIEFAGGTMLLYFLGSVAMLFGVQGWQQVSSLRASLKAKTPPKHETTVIQTGNQEANVNPPTE